MALAAALKADECQIYTDVDGVYTTDPRIVPEARRLKTITFEEMLEMASLGSKVLQIRSVEFAGKYKVKLRVLSSFQESGDGTLITFEENDIMEQAIISGIAFNRDEAKITVQGVPDRPGIAYQILGPVADANIDVDMIVQNVGHANTTDFTFTVHRNDFAKAMAIVQTTATAIGAREVSGDDKIAKVSMDTSKSKSDKMADVKKDAVTDEKQAMYKAANERCDALAGAPKDACQADAKAKYGMK